MITDYSRPYPLTTHEVYGFSPAAVAKWDELKAGLPFTTTYTVTYASCGLPTVMTITAAPEHREALRKLCDAVRAADAEAGWQ